ncbi:hypothetical protein [uncultured Ruminococcus sp.]|uniref:hypothetical protein n=1 Tax=uncultured Ruminococcus sp. TaxID=165186 RepID=UPI0026025D44|nr:hypothetical protein [uncultured Ruminococcus sp.]
MEYRRIMAGAAALVLAVCAAGCADKKDSSTKSEETTEATTAAEVTTEEDTTEEEKQPPTPVDCDDPNAVTFDDGVFDFASAKSDDPDCASGELSVEELMGNKMLKFTDDNTVPLSGKVQKIDIRVLPLIGAEGAAKVRRIEFDLYAQATADGLKTDDAEGVRAPGWIGGGGGTVTADNDKWYDFQAFEGGEYDFETSGPVHAKFKFLLADSGQCWTEDMEDPNFLIMRWGVANESDIYIDNIVFYDEDDNSIPLISSGSTADELKEEAEKAADELKAEAEKAKDELMAESEQKFADLKADYEKAKSELENSAEYADIKAKIDEAEKKLKEDTAKAQEAIEEASKMIEDARNK